MHSFTVKVLESLGVVLVLASSVVVYGLARLSFLCSRQRENVPADLPNQLPADLCGLDCTCASNVLGRKPSGNAHQRRIVRRKSLRSGSSVA